MDTPVHSRTFSYRAWACFSMSLTGPLNTGRMDWDGRDKPPKTHATRLRLFFSQFQQTLPERERAHTTNCLAWPALKWSISFVAFFICYLVFLFSVCIFTFFYILFYKRVTKVGWNDWTVGGQPARWTRSSGCIFLRYLRWQRKKKGEARVIQLLFPWTLVVRWTGVVRMYPFHDYLFFQLLL